MFVYISNVLIQPEEKSKHPHTPKNTHKKSDLLLLN